jgi:cardiolipin synthase
MRRVMQRLRMVPRPQVHLPPLQPVVAAFVVRDNVRRRRTIERAYVEAIRSARDRVDLVCPYFYPGHVFRLALRRAAERGVRVRLLMQGVWDYRAAALAARALYGELLGRGVRIYEYTPAFLHAKVAVVDDDWATVGSSNIDPLSLLLNLEANVIVRDADFNAALSRELDAAFAASREVTLAEAGGRVNRLRRGCVAWCARIFLRIAGATGRY